MTARITLPTLTPTGGYQASIDPWEALQKPTRRPDYERGTYVDDCRGCGKLVGVELDEGQIIVARTDGKMDGGDPFCHACLAPSGVCCAGALPIGDAARDPKSRDGHVDSCLDSLHFGEWVVSLPEDERKAVTESFRDDRRMFAKIDIAQRAAEGRVPCDRRENKETRIAV